MTKQETAQQIVRQVLEFMQENNYIDSWEINGLNESGDIEQLQDIAQASIEEFMGKDTHERKLLKELELKQQRIKLRRNQAAPCVRSDDCLQYLAGKQAAQ